jgi:hypothetical protein
MGTLRGKFSSAKTGHRKVYFLPGSQKSDSIFSTVVDVSFLSDASYSAEDHEAYHALFVTSEGNETVAERPHTYLLTPVYERLGNKSSDVVGAFVSTVAFDRYLADLLPDRVRGIFAILKNTCGQE